MTNVHQLALPGVIAEQTIEWVWAEESEGDNEVTFAHTTVMKEEVVLALAPRDGEVYVDATLGGGGHTEAILAAASGARASSRSPRRAGGGGSAGAALALRRRGHDRAIELRAARRGAPGNSALTTVDGLCADLGVSSPQLDDAERGMSFRREGPIDMRMDPRRAGEDGPRADRPPGRRSARRRDLPLR